MAGVRGVVCCYECRACLGAGAAAFAFDLPAQANAQRFSVGAAGVGPFGLEAKCQRGFFELAPAVDVNAEERFAFTVGEANDNARGCIGVLQDVGAALYLPAALPVRVIFGSDRDAATALDGFGAGKVQARLQVFCGLAHAPALDHGRKAGAGDSGKDGQNGHHHHHFQQAKAALSGALPQGWWRESGSTSIRKIEIHVSDSAACAGRWRLCKDKWRSARD